MANLDKAVSAAQKQISEIQILKEKGVWENLPEQLRLTGELRLNHPELSLSQLSELGGISKSCLNHRLRKLTDLASTSKGE
jgi:DNA-binding protein WhiA